MSQISNGQSGRKKNTVAIPTATPPVQTVKTEPQTTEPKVLIKSLKIVGKLEYGSGYFYSNDFKDSMKELEKDLRLRYQFSGLKVSRGEKMDFEEAKELAKKETGTYVLWLGFVARKDSSNVLFFDYAQYAVLAPQTGEFITKGTFEPRMNEIGIPPIPSSTRRLPTLSHGMKESVRRISKILQNGGWFD